MSILSLAALAACASDRPKQGSAAITQGVRTVFGYQDVAAGKVRSFDKPTLERIGQYFSPALREKIASVLRIESTISRAPRPEKNSPARNEADLIFSGDPLTNRFNKPDKVEISGPENQVSSVAVTVIDTYKDEGKVVGRKKAVVTLVPSGADWVIDEVRFTSDKSEPVALSTILDDLTLRLDELREQSRSR
jgi:hypothetical protein